MTWMDFVLPIATGIVGVAAAPVTTWASATRQRRHAFDDELRPLASQLVLEGRRWAQGGRQIVRQLRATIGDPDYAITSDTLQASLSATMTKTFVTQASAWREALVSAGMVARSRDVAAALDELRAFVDGRKDPMLFIGIAWLNEDRAFLTSTLEMCIEQFNDFDRALSALERAMAAAPRRRVRPWRRGSPKRA